jgi:hypothetical protein
MSYPVPAPSHLLFIDAFEQFTHERQKQINQVRDLHRPYEIVRVCLEKFKLPNDIKMKLVEEGIDVSIVIGPDDPKGYFDPLITAIGEDLRIAGLHPDGQPAMYETTGAWISYWRLRSTDQINPPTITILVQSPLGGTRYIKITRWEETKTYKAYCSKYEWLDEPHGEESRDNEDEQTPF